MNKHYGYYGYGESAGERIAREKAARRKWLNAISKKRHGRKG